MSEQIQPGTPVRVVIEGTATSRGHRYAACVETSGNGMYYAAYWDSAVRIIPLDPERPALNRETIARTLNPYAWKEPLATHLGARVRRETSLDQADAIRALIEAAHPEWTP